MENQFDVVVIGGGIIGLASAYKIGVRHPHLKILVLEKEDRLAVHQTGHNSGVIHSGLYYTPGSYKAKNCVAGRHELVAFAREHKIAHEICGKIVVATDAGEQPVLERIYQNGLANGVEGIEKIGPEKIREIEPNCRGVEAIRVPCTGIIDFSEVTLKLSGLVRGRPGSAVLIGHVVRGVEQRPEGTVVHTGRGSFSARHVVACAGLHSDRVAKMAGARPGMRIVGFRGDYYRLKPEAEHLVRHLIYPVPDPRFPFLGVHFTRMIGGGVECGPNAVFSFKREGYRKTAFSMADSFDALTYGGTWRLFFRHWRSGLDEYRRAFSKRRFVQSLQKMIPGIGEEHVEPDRAGVRAVALKPDGNLIDDFRIVNEGNTVHILNAPSPAATSALSIGEAVAAHVNEYFQLRTIPEPTR